MYRLEWRSQFSSVSLQLSLAFSRSLKNTGAKDRMAKIAKTMTEVQENAWLELVNLFRVVPAWMKKTLGGATPATSVHSC